MTKRIVLLAALLGSCSLASVGTLPAAGASGPSMTVSRTTSLLNGQLVSVVGSGFTPMAVSDVVECSTAPGQPTIDLDGFAIRVSCGAPLGDVAYPFAYPSTSTVASDGSISTAIVVHTGIIGPPTLGIDSTGHNSAADAALYPCPPTEAQQSAGVTCELTLGDSQGLSASVPISFGSPLTTSASITTSPSTGLSSGEEVTLNGAGFTPGSPWLALECNLTPGEPTGAEGLSDLPISCDETTSVPATSFSGGSTFPTSDLTDAFGSMSTTLAIAEGNVGGSEQSAAYPCPPSASDLAFGGSCAVVVVDGAGELVTSPLSITGPVPVASISASPSTGVSTGETLTVTGDNFISNQLAGLLECNGTAGQPTIGYDGIQVPVSCSVPQLVSTSATGGFSATFSVIEGVTGPPAQGTDSTGGSASTDAASYPCPPTATQAFEGATCNISAGDLSGDVASAPISFASPPPTTTAPGQAFSPCTGTSGNAAFICLLYEDLLERAPPDPAGLSFWESKLTSGTSLSQVAYDIVTSAEYRADLVEAYYQKFLGRPADPEGLSLWVRDLSNATSDQGVMEQILGSAEFYADSGGNPIGFISDLYEKLLGRPVDTVGLFYWDSKLSSGTSRAGVVAGLLSSNEWTTDFINAQYVLLLGRSADPEGLAYWSGKLNAGASYESVISGIAGSTEFYLDASS